MKVIISFSTSQSSRESRIFSHDYRVLAEGSSLLLDITYGIVTDTDSGCDVCKCPEAAFKEVDPFFLEILKFLFLD